MDHGNDGQLSFPETRLWKTSLLPISAIEGKVGCEADVQQGLQKQTHGGKRIKVPAGGVRALQLPILETAARDARARLTEQHYVGGRY